LQTHGAGLTTPSGDLIPLSWAVEADGLVFFSGQVAVNEGRIPDGIEAQTDLIFDLLEAKLAELGLSLDHVAKATVWLTEPTHFGRFNAVYTARMGKPYPARSCVVSAMVLPGALVEIEIVASRSRRSA
jgi:2-iminobutanoate/2-iminopropanoate deaminase